jgi:hypothetical protein
MHFVAVARKLLCSSCWREMDQQRNKGAAGQLALAGVELAQREGAIRG